MNDCRQVLHCSTVPAKKQDGLRSVLHCFTLKWGSEYRILDIGIIWVVRNSGHGLNTEQLLGI